MADIINLRTVRKAKARSEAERRAEENRVKFGRSKPEKNATRAEKNRADTAHEAGRIDGAAGALIAPGKPDDPAN